MGTQTQVNKSENKNIKNKASSFFKVFSISTAIFLIIISIMAGLYLTSTIKPPEIPIMVVAADTLPEIDMPAFTALEGEEADMLIGDGLIAPTGFTDEDRKVSFYTFLIVGLDEGINSDAIMVASYDAGIKEGNVISIPRDSLVNVSRRIRKINAAFPAGTIYGGGLEGGVAQLSREVKTVIGFVPDYYVCIDLDAFVKIVNAVGGVEVDVPFHMRYRDPDQGLYIDIKKGLQLLDGETALKFARYRLGNGSRSITDYQRMEHQQMVIKAVLASLLKPANILKIPQFIDIFNENVHTDLTTGNMLWFASQLIEIRGTDSLSTHTLPTNGNIITPISYELLDAPAIVELVNRTINPFKIDIEIKDLDIVTE